VADRPAMLEKAPGNLVLPERLRAQPLGFLPTKEFWRDRVRSRHAQPLQALFTVMVTSVLFVTLVLAGLAGFSFAWPVSCAIAASAFVLSIVSHGLFERWVRRQAIAGAAASSRALPDRVTDVPPRNR
jgi:hypothetical protein